MSKNLVRSAKAEYVPVRVRVTDRDIDKGDMGQPRSCPIARAVKRVVKSGTAVYVGGDSLTICNNGKRYRKGLPEWAREFVGTFDATPSYVDPLRATLKLPKPLVKRFGR